jgi:hypothetical protein
LKRILGLIIVINCQLLIANCQLPYWQQQVNYTITVSLNDKEHTLDGLERIDYINNSPDTLRFIWFHLWPNAYKNDKTAFSDQLLENGNTKFYFSNNEDRGYINKLDFKVNNITATTEDHPQHIDIIKLILPSPLPPGQKISITTPFHVKLPYNFSRGGHDGESYQATQWYPKPAVYDKNGWHPMPYLDQGEFYSEFGSFDVSITVPANYVVAATGELQNKEEKEWMNARGSFNWKTEKQTEKNSFGQVKIVTKQFPSSSAQLKTLRFKQDNIHDFAWFADKRFVIKHDTLMLSSGKTIDVYAFYINADHRSWQNAVHAAKKSIHHYSSLVGEYPYNIVSVVEGPQSFGGGMEYPTITVISPNADVKSLDHTIAHEVGHNWFYGILGSNERKHPWMDEGINTYYDSKYKTANDHHYTGQAERMIFETFAATKKDQPVETPSEKFSVPNYGIIAYYKASQWVALLEKQLGQDLFNKSMQEYFRQWQFKHPQPEDLKAVLEKVSGQNLDSAFALLHKTGILPGVKRKGVTFQNPITGLMRSSFGVTPEKNSVINFFPAFGFNSYDKFTAGIGITNFRLPSNRFQFLLLPMYATGSKKIKGLGLAYYTFYPEKFFRKIELGASAISFTADEYIDSAGKKISLAFQKIVPGIKFTFKEKNPRSSFNRFILFKSFMIREEGLRFFRDSMPLAGGGYSYFFNYRKTEDNRVLNQLKLVIENNRVLYPYRGELKIEQGKDFIRPAFTGNYFFNYPKEGGLDVRLFASKFIYTRSKTITRQFATSRYHLNMTGANGYEDYTYSDYFIGRNKFDGLASQQIMLRDGGFKVRTDLLASKVAKTDDWLIAANFVTTIPSSMNPLSMLPVKIPLKVFVDIGTYAEAWKNKEENDRFLYDAGLQLSLARGLINIYMPLVYSSVYKDYILSTIEKKNRFFKKMSFTIDISNFSSRKIDRNLTL